jgi:YegS/Rv2252/BmrU family lipid kinase
MQKSNRKKICLILNSKSGKTNKLQKVEALKKAFANFAVDPKIEIFNFGTSVEEKVKQAISEGFDTIVAVGGDGTISSVAGALLNTEATLGIIPAGTLNHFAKDLNIPSELDEAIKIITEGQSKKIDVCSVNDRVFINNSGVGIYPKIVRKREVLQSQGKNKWIAFWIAAKQVWEGYPFLKIKVSSEEKSFLCKTPFVFIGNNEYEFEGVELGTRKNLDQSALSVYVARRAKKKGLLRFIWLALIRRLLEHEEFEFFMTKDLTIETKKKFLQVSLDGEVTPLQTPLHYKIHPKSLTVLVK